MTNEEILKKVIKKVVENGWSKVLVDHYKMLQKEPDQEGYGINEEEWEPINYIYDNYFGWEGPGLNALMIFSQGLNCLMDFRLF